MPRKQKTIHYLYKTTCLVTNRYYIGMHSADNLEDGYIGSGRRLRKSIRKYGIENHEKQILEFFENRDLLIEAEKVAITPEMLVDKNCMNLMGGGTGGFISDEQQRHRSICGGKAHKQKMFDDLEYRDVVVERLRNTMKKSHKEGKIKYNTFEGKTHSEETKQKMSNSSKGIGVGEKNSQYGTCWITKDGVNKKIKKENLEDYLNNGWSKGRKI
jgi:hypothetical protein